MAVAPTVSHLLLALMERDAAVHLPLRVAALLEVAHQRVHYMQAVPICLATLVTCHQTTTVAPILR